eukprot:5502136-Alexandrium_andersonii.AAC.1
MCIRDRDTPPGAGGAGARARGHEGPRARRGRQDVLLGPAPGGRLPAGAGRQAGATVLPGAAPLRQAPARAREAPRPCSSG